MNINPGETVIIKTKNERIGEVRIWNVEDKKLLFTWGKYQDKGFINLETGMSTVPANVLDAVQKEL